MQKELIILVVGTVLGFLSAIFLEFTKSRLENKRLKQERAMESKEEQEKELRNFLLSTSDKKIAPAWLTLVETNRTLPLFQKQQTDDVMSANILKKSDQSGLEAEVKPTLDKFLLKQTQIIGRQDDCEIRLTDSTVSRLHAMIRYEDGFFVLYDLASKSGSLVNNKKVNKEGATLHFGDQVQIGESIFIFGGWDVGHRQTGDRNAEAKITKPPRPSKSGNRKSG